MPETVASVGVLALKVATDGFDILRIDGGHHHRSVHALPRRRISGEPQVGEMRAHQRVDIAKGEGVVAP